MLPVEYLQHHPLSLDSENKRGDGPTVLLKKLCQRMFIAVSYCIQQFRVIIEKE